MGSPFRGRLTWDVVIVCPVGAGWHCVRDPRVPLRSTPGFRRAPRCGWGVGGLWVRYWPVGFIGSWELAPPLRDEEWRASGLSPRAVDEGTRTRTPTRRDGGLCGGQVVVGSSMSTALRAEYGYEYDGGCGSWGHSPHRRGDDRRYRFRHRGAEVPVMQVAVSRSRCGAPTDGSPARERWVLVIKSDPAPAGATEGLGVRTDPDFCRPSGAWNVLGHGPHG